MTASIQSRRGSSPPHSVWSQSPPVIQVPGGTVAANALMRATNSSRVARIAKLHGCQAESAVEEVHVRVDEAGNDELSAEIDDLGGSGSLPDVGRDVPTATIRSPAMAIASAFGLRRVAGPDPAVDECQRDHGTSGLL